MADFFGLGGYGSGSSSGSEDSAAQQPQGAAQQPTRGHDEDDSEEEASVDSAQARAMAADARLKDYGHEAATRAAAAEAAATLPSVADAFNEVEGPPAFLDPEATRPIATSAVHGTVGGVGSGAQAPATGARTGASGFDVAKLAPLLKGQKRDGDSDSPAGTVIEGKAKRCKNDDNGPGYNAAQIAMLGGNISTGCGAQAEGMGPTPPPAAPAPVRGPSKPMAQADFLAKGEGAALLPRKTQERKDKEKLKRMKGQSAIGSWKTEAEMVLRQNYDS